MTLILASCKSKKDEKPIDISEEEGAKSFSELLKAGTDFSMTAKESVSLAASRPVRFFTDGKTGYLFDSDSIRTYTAEKGIGDPAPFDGGNAVSGTASGSGLVFLTETDGDFYVKTVDPKTFSEKNVQKIFFAAHAIAFDPKTAGYYLIDGTEKIVLLDRNFENRDIFAGIGGDYSVFGAFVCDSYLCVGEARGGDVCLWIYENGAYKTCVDLKVTGSPVGVGLLGDRIAVCTCSENNFVISTLEAEY